MTLENRPNAELLALWKQGNQQAASVLTDRYMQRLTALARSRLSHKLARRLDADDIVMSAFRSFFIAARHSRIQTPDDDNLWPLLVIMTMRKLQRQVQRHKSERRDIENEVFFDDLGAWQEIVARDPSPEEAAQVSLDLESLMSRLSSFDRQILTLRLQGEDFLSIATRLNCSERTIRRAMNTIRSSLNAHFDVPSDEQPTSDLRIVTPRVDRMHKSPTMVSPSLKYRDFILQRLIGSGGFGKVYRARRSADGQIVAVKYLLRRLWRNKTAVQVLIEETQKTLSVSHAHILRYDGWGTAPSGAPFLVMEFIDGPNLAAWRHSPQFDISELISCGIQIADALAALHRAGLIHGDVAPGNILRRNPRDFVLTDFGLSRASSDTDATGFLRPMGGTPGFLAPEQLSTAFGMYSERTDIYGLGAILYFLATKQPPFTGHDEADTFSLVLSSRPPKPVPAEEEVREPLCRVIMRCLAKEPSERFASAIEVRDALQGC
ncbi:MAG: protein kinase [Planctomycetaceae bacterium]|nr:protein kinase [Planctomycetaceae bacterium]